MCRALRGMPEPDSVALITNVRVLVSTGDKLGDGLYQPPTSELAHDVLTKLKVARCSLQFGRKKR